MALKKIFCVFEIKKTGLNNKNLLAIVFCFVLKAERGAVMHSIKSVDVKTPL